MKPDVEDKQKSEARPSALEQAVMAADVSADLRWVLDKLPDGVLFLDREWRITYANEQGRKVIRLHPEDLNGPSHWELFPAAVGTEQEYTYRRVMEDRVMGSWSFSIPRSSSGCMCVLCPSPVALQ